MDNNDFVSGQGFCCNDNSPEVARAKMLKARAVSDNFHIIADHPQYGRFRINTIDVLKTPTKRELRNIGRIRQQIGSSEPLLLIPK